MKLSDITRFVNSRSMVAVAGILLLLVARVAFDDGDINYLTVDRGILFPSANMWIGDRWLTMTVSTGLLLAAALGWLVIIQFFNPFRALTTLPSSLFLVMMLSVPDITDQLCTGTVLVLAVAVCVALLWTSYANPFRMRHIFLLFAILSALTMTQYCFAVYIPVFLIGCVQMKIFSLRTVIACVLGLVTPWWIVLGSGLVGFGNLHLPSAGTLFGTFDIEDTVYLLFIAVACSALMVVAWGANFINVLSLNANLRAFNGSLSLISIFTVVAMCVDYTNAAAYMPLLMLMSSYQLGFMLGRSENSRRFIPVIGIMMIFVASAVVRLFM